MGEFDLAPTIAVNCGDQAQPTTTDQVEDLASRAGRSATVSPDLVSGYIRAFALPCVGWPALAPDAPHPVTAAGSPAILVIGNVGDNVTSYDTARRIAGTLEDGRLLTYHGSGHTTYGKSACADAYIDSYLMGLALPLNGADCPQ